MCSGGGQFLPWVPAAEEVLGIDFVWVPVAVVGMRLSAAPGAVGGVSLPLWGT